MLVAAVAFGLAIQGCGDTEAPPAAPTPEAAETSTPADRLLTNLDAVIAAHRQTIVLMWDEETLAEADRPYAFIIGKLLYEGNLPREDAISEQLQTEVTQAAAADFAKPTQLTSSFLDALEHSADWHDADKLAFKDIVNDLEAHLRELAPASAAGKGLLTRLAEDSKALATIQGLYDKELDKVFGRFETRGMEVRREAWEDYIAFLRTLYNAEAILDAHRSEIEALPTPAPATPVTAPAKVLSGWSLPDKNLVLTFDDGPHIRNTAKIVEILEDFGIKSIFFAVGRKLGRHGAGGELRVTTEVKRNPRVLDNGHLVANHTRTHPFLPKLESDEVGAEIDQTTRLLNDVWEVEPALFRPPYGAINDTVKRLVAERNLRIMLWNIDSQDWADPVPKSIANRVIADARRKGRGVILFHDIQSRTVEALPLVIETLLAEGFHFVLWDGNKILDPGPPPATPTPPATSSEPLYRTSFAVIIGINKYQSWPRLQYAVNDATAVRDMLVDQLRFKPENVFVLLDEDATRERILALLGETLADPQRVGREDRVVVFYAGHGATRRLPSGRSLGYIIPVDAGTDSYPSQAISMTTFQDINEAIPAKHILYLMDACYGGLALVRGGATGAGSANYLAEVTRRLSRQMLTAGGPDEEVADTGPGGHSIFTWTLLQGLGGEADLNHDRFITVAELFTYTGPMVASLSQQTPAFGNMIGSQGGEMVFELEPEDEFLSDLSQQLDDESIRLNAELEAVRQRIAAKSTRNRELAAELRAAQEELARLDSTARAEESAGERASRLLGEGLTLYRAKELQAALERFREAFEAQPSNAQAANNVGFVYFKLGRYEEALEWYQRTTALDPERAVAFLNTGEVLDKLGRESEAVTVYRRYLELAPRHASAERVRERLRKGAPDTER
jgi:peptidoglycan/xylan/chitin deacetylase (PgdA/CDA1 family)/regulator of sirC expression with transglutaminase-like and TPR domain